MIYENLYSSGPISMVMITLPGKIAQIIKQGHIELDYRDAVHTTVRCSTACYNYILVPRPLFENRITCYSELISLNNKNFHSELALLT